MTDVHAQLKRLVEESEALDKAATVGPWGWRTWSGPPMLVGERGCRPIVIDAVRSGMNGASLRFAKRDAVDKGGILCKAEEFWRNNDLDHPDAAFIARARILLPRMAAVLKVLAPFEWCVGGKMQKVHCVADSDLQRAPGEQREGGT